MNHPSISHVHGYAAKLVRVLLKCAASLSLLGFLYGLGDAQSPDIVKSIERAKKTIVPIVCLARDVKTGSLLRFRIFGTGFMVDAQGTFITAEHVMESFGVGPWKETCLPVITFPVGGWKREAQDVKWFAVDFAGCQINKQWDVAICKTTEDMSKQTAISYEVATLSKERPPDGTSVFFTGFPLQATDPITSIGAIAGFTAADKYNTLLIDKNAWPGASGSPIYLTSENKIIGMLTKTGTGDATGISFGVAGERLVNILASARTNWAKDQTKQPEKQ